MKTDRYSTSRRKVCRSCSAAKAKCDRKPEGCARCAIRGLSCDYTSNRTSPDFLHGSPGKVNETRQPSSNYSQSAANGLLSGPDSEGPRPMDSSGLTVESWHCLGESSPSTFRSTSRLDGISPDTFESEEAVHVSQDSKALDFLGLELTCPINVDDIRNRWMNSFVPVIDQKAKNYPSGVRLFINRMLNSYTSVMVSGRGLPPFIHHYQMLATSTRGPLSTTISLARICEKVFPGSESVAADILQREMSSICEQQDTYNDVALLAAFQSYLIYSMILYFRLKQVSMPILRQAMANLQQLAYLTCKHGLVCIAEGRRERPRWEAWIIAEAKRRTLFTMYLFDSLLLAEDGLPTFLGIELEGLPTSSNRSLWNARNRCDWDTAYNVHLADWADGDFRIDELWPQPEDDDENKSSQTRDRADRWLQGVDEFGVMLYAVTSCTHGN